jgi:hypothetical protein
MAVGITGAMEVILFFGIAALVNGSYLPHWEAVQPIQELAP